MDTTKENEYHQTSPDRTQKWNLGQRFGNIAPKILRIHENTLTSNNSVYHLRRIISISGRPGHEILCHRRSRGFLTAYSDRTIINEVQRVPTLFSYIQTHTDKENRERMYLLAGSHNYFSISIYSVLLVELLEVS